MNCYIASSSKDFARVREFKSQLESLGYNFQGDWSEYAEQAHKQGIKSDADLEVSLQSEIASFCEKSVYKADFFVYLVGSPTQGALVEFGLARASGKPCYVVGEWNSAFTQLADRHFATPEEFVEWARSQEDIEGDVRSRAL